MVWHNTLDKRQSTMILYWIFRFSAIALLGSIACSIVLLESHTDKRPMNQRLARYHIGFEATRDVAFLFTIASLFSIIKYSWMV